jgi:hypothetical protein
MTLSLPALAERILADATTIARQTTSPIGQSTAEHIAQLAHLFRSLDLETEPCACPVCTERPDLLAGHPPCEGAVDDAMYGASTRLGVAIDDLTVEQICDQIILDAQPGSAPTDPAPSGGPTEHPAYAGSPHEERDARDKNGDVHGTFGEAV